MQQIVVGDWQGEEDGRGGVREEEKEERCKICAITTTQDYRTYAPLWQECWTELLLSNSCAKLEALCLHSYLPYLQLHSSHSGKIFHRALPCSWAGNTLSHSHFLPRKFIAPWWSAVTSQHSLKLSLALQNRAPAPVSAKPCPELHLEAQMSPSVPGWLCLQTLGLSKPNTSSFSEEGQFIEWILTNKQ